MLAWHFIRDDCRLRFGRRTGVRVGQTLRRDPAQLELCRYGLHASVNPLDALRYAPGTVACRVRLGGRIVRGSDKLVASRRTVLAMADVSRELRLWACWCVRHTPLPNGRTVWDLLTDERSRAAVETVERYAAGEATEDELRHAADAARSAACAVWRAAWRAADDAADATGHAADAAWRAADATGHAADAAWRAADAARHAADAARSAARGASDAAWHAARRAQSAELERVLLAALKLGEGP